MRISMKVWEFAEYLEKNQFKRISYESRSQSWYDPAHTLYLHLVFDAVRVRENPNGLFFYRDGEFVMALPHVKTVFLNETRSTQSQDVVVVSESYPGVAANDVSLTLYRS